MLLVLLTTRGVKSRCRNESREFFPRDYFYKPTLHINVSVKALVYFSIKFQEFVFVTAYLFQTRNAKWLKMYYKVTRTPSEINNLKYRIQHFTNLNICSRLKFLAKYLNVMMLSKRLFQSFKLAPYRTMCVVSLSQTPLKTSIPCHRDNLRPLWDNICSRSRMLHVRRYDRRP